VANYYCLYLNRNLLFSYVPIHKNPEYISQYILHKLRNPKTLFDNLRMPLFQEPHVTILLDTRNLSLTVDKNRTKSCGSDTKIMSHVTKLNTQILSIQCIGFDGKTIEVTAKVKDTETKAIPERSLRTVEVRFVRKCYHHIKQVPPISGLACFLFQT